MSNDLNAEIEKRRTFGIISHPDAGKTTLTEKFLLFGGAIQVAGAIKAKKATRHATSDFMEIEKQRGISVATSVMGFEYKQKKLIFWIPLVTKIFVKTRTEPSLRLILLLWLLIQQKALNHKPINSWKCVE